jgi:hypothetical protein
VGGSKRNYRWIMYELPQTVLAATLMFLNVARITGRSCHATFWHLGRPWRSMPCCRHALPNLAG